MNPDEAYRRFRGLLPEEVYRRIDDHRWNRRDVQEFIDYALQHERGFGIEAVEGLWAYFHAREARRQLRESAINCGAKPVITARASDPIPQPKKETTMTPQEQLKQAQDAVIAAEKAVADAAIKAAFDARINREIELAQSTSLMLQQIKGPIDPGARSVFATFRNELNPLALTYGYKLVLVGDKSTATLVKV